MKIDVTIHADPEFIEAIKPVLAEIIEKALGHAGAVKIKEGKTKHNVKEIPQGEKLMGPPPPPICKPKKEKRGGKRGVAEKECLECGKRFQGSNNRQMKCDDCRGVKKKLK